MIILELQKETYNSLQDQVRRFNVNTVFNEMNREKLDKSQQELHKQREAYKTTGSNSAYNRMTSEAEELEKTIDTYEKYLGMLRNAQKRFKEELALYFEMMDQTTRTTTELVAQMLEEAFQPDNQDAHVELSILENGDILISITNAFIGMTSTSTIKAPTNSANHS